MSDRDRFDSARTRTRLRPPPGVRANRASAWCGAQACGRYVIAAASEEALDALLAAWRCPRCERGVW